MSALLGQKCNERASVRSLVGYMANSTLWDFAFQAAYQSTDESDDDDAVDPDTETEDEVPVRTKQKPWISRPPTYRGAVIQDGFDDLDEQVKKQRKENAKNYPAQTRPHPRRRGNPKNVSLPYISTRGIKIPREGVDTKWLQMNPDEDRPTRIAPPAELAELEESEGCSDEGQGENDDDLYA